MADKKTTAIVPFEGFDVLPAEVQEKAMQEFLKSEEEFDNTVEMRMSVIKTGQSGKFEFDDDNMPSVKEIECVWLTAYKKNVYWHVQGDYILNLPDDFDKNRPVCSSIGAVTGEPGLGFEGENTVSVKYGDGEPVPKPCFGECGTDKSPICFFNHYKTKTNNETGIYEGGGGKACTNMVEIIAIVKGFDDPFVISLKSSSFYSISTYRKFLKNSKVAPWGVWTKMVCKSDSNGGKRYGLLDACSVIRPITGEELPAILEARDLATEYVQSITTKPKG